VPIVIVGDLNATPWSHAFRATDLRNGKNGSGRQPTFMDGTGHSWCRSTPCSTTQPASRTDREELPLGSTQPDPQRNGRLERRRTERAAELLVLRNRPGSAHGRYLLSAHGRLRRAASNASSCITPEAMTRTSPSNSP
jgi:hypothetical protein